MMMLNKCSRSPHTCSVKMHILISGYSADKDNTTVQWGHHKCELGGDIGILRLHVRFFRRMLPVKFHHQTSYRSQFFAAVNMKSQSDRYFIIRKAFLNKTYSKLNQNFNIHLHCKMSGSHSQSTAG